MALTIDVPPLIAFFPPHLAVLEVCAGRPGDVEVFAESRWERGVLHLQQIGVRAVLVAAVYIQYRVCHLSLAPTIKQLNIKICLVTLLFR